MKASDLPPIRSLVTSLLYAIGPTYSMATAAAAKTTRMSNSLSISKESFTAYGRLLMTAPPSLIMARVYMSLVQTQAVEHASPIFTPASSLSYFKNLSPRKYHMRLHYHL